LATTAQGSAKHRLALAIAAGGVDQRDPGLERDVDQPDSLSFGWAAVLAGCRDAILQAKLHSAERQCGDAQACAAEGALVHVAAPLISHHSAAKDTQDDC